MVIRPSATSRCCRNRPSILTVRSPAGTFPQVCQNRQLPPIHHCQIRQLNSQFRNSLNSSGLLRRHHLAGHYLPASCHHPAIHHDRLLELRRELVPGPALIARQKFINPHRQNRACRHHQRIRYCLTHLRPWSFLRRLILSVRRVSHLPVPRIRQPVRILRRIRRPRLRLLRLLLPVLLPLLLRLALLLLLPLLLLLARARRRTKADRKTQPRCRAQYPSHFFKFNWVIKHAHCSLDPARSNLAASAPRLPSLDSALPLRDAQSLPALAPNTNTIAPFKFRGLASLFL